MSKRAFGMLAGQWPVLATVAALAVAPLLVPQFYVTLLNYIGLYSLVALGLLLLTGVAGQTSFGDRKSTRLNSSHG